MIRTLMKSKIHRAKVTRTDINYNGSIIIDSGLCAKADLLEHEKVDIYNLNTGARFSTYVLYGDKGVISVNGSAARLVQKDDLVIIVSYAQYAPEECKNHKPLVLCMENDRDKRAGSAEPRVLSAV